MSGAGGNGAAGGREPSLQRGCMMGIVVLFLLAIGLGYMWWRAFNKFNPPTELRAYAFEETFDSLLTAEGGVRDEAKPLDSAEFVFYLGAVDTLWSAWGEFQRVYDSAAAERDPDETFDPMELDEVGVVYWRVPLYARRALVDYLNGEDRSWRDYLTIKKRVVAASGITHREMGDSLIAFMQRLNFEVGDDNDAVPNASFFIEVEEIRDREIDSAERALVAPYRELLLTRGLVGLSGTEEMFYGEE